MAIAHVQGDASGLNFVNSTTLSQAFPSPVTSGSLIVGSVQWDNSFSPSITGVTDDKGNTYHFQDTTIDTAHGQVGATFYSENVTNAPTTVTVTFDTACAFNSMCISEFSGVATSSSIDGHKVTYNTSMSTTANAMTSGTITTTAAGDLIYGACFAGNGSNASLGTGYTDSDSGGVGLVAEYQIQTSAGSIATTFTASSGATMVAFIIAFKAAGGGGGSTVSLACAVTMSITSTAAINRKRGIAGTATMAVTGTVAINRNRQVSAAGSMAITGTAKINRLRQIAGDETFAITGTAVLTKLSAQLLYLITWIR